MSVGKWTLEGDRTRAQLLDRRSAAPSSDPYIMVLAYFQCRDLSPMAVNQTAENPNAQAIQDKDIDSGWHKMRVSRKPIFFLILTLSERVVAST